MYLLLVFKPFSLKVVRAVVCENMKQVLEAAENVDPNVDVESLFYDDDAVVETDSFIFRLTNPEYATCKV